MKKILFIFCLFTLLFTSCNETSEGVKSSALPENSYYTYDYTTRKAYKITDTTFVRKNGDTNTITRVKISKILSIKIPERLNLEIDTIGRSEVLKRLYAGDTLYSNGITLLGDKHFSFWKTTKLGYVYNDKKDDIEQINQKTDFKLTLLANITTCFWAFLWFFSMHMLIQFLRKREGLMIILFLFFSSLFFYLSFYTIIEDPKEFKLVNLTNISSLLGLLTALLVYHYRKNKKQNEEKPV